MPWRPLADLIRPIYTLHQAEERQGGTADQSIFRADLRNLLGMVKSTRLIRMTDSCQREGTPPTCLERNLDSLGPLCWALRSFKYWQLFRRHKGGTQ